MATACEAQCGQEVHEVELFALGDDSHMGLPIGLAAGGTGEGGQFTRQPAFGVHDGSVERVPRRWRQTDSGCVHGAPYRARERLPSVVYPCHTGENTHGGTIGS